MLAVGDQVDKYVVEAEIGGGGMARLYRVRHAVLDVCYALKVLEPAYREQPQLRERFLSEGKIAAKLKHPNIVRVVDTVSTTEVAGLVMEFVEGPDLEDYIRGRSAPLSAEEIRAIFLPVLDAIGAAHKAGIIHRDIKPGNILLEKTADGICPKVTDFGIAKVSAAAGIPKKGRTRADAKIGTPEYMSPEQIRRPTEVTPRSDIFALGATLYELATGTVAFDGDTEYEVMDRIVKGPRPPVPPTVDAVIAAAIRRALEIDPAARFASCGEFAAALRSSQGFPAPRAADRPAPRAVDPPRRQVTLEEDGAKAGEAPNGTDEQRAEACFNEGRWAELEPILDRLVRKADGKDPKERNQLYYRVARTADELQQTEKALTHYHLAFELDATYLPTLLGWAALLYRTEQWDQAFKLYQTVLVHHRDAQKDGDIVDIFYRLGTIKLKLGEQAKALKMYEYALEVDPQHEATLLAVIDLRSRSNEWEAVVQAKRALAAAAAEDEQGRLLDEIGDIYRTRLRRPDKATEAYLEAVVRRPGDQTILHKVLDLYTETKQWRKASGLLVRLGEMEVKGPRRAKYYYTAAIIQRDEIKSPDDALELYNKALDNDPDILKAFEAIDRICTQKQDWRTLERNYRRMLKRMPQESTTPEQEDLKIMLWHNLGEIYRVRLKDLQSAAACFEVAAGMQPENPQRREILAELYGMIGPEAASKAVAEHQALIKNSPFKIDSYRALRRAYMDSKQYDKAWCLCGALSFLKQADPEEQQFFEQYRAKGFVRAKQRLTDEIWVGDIFHPDQDRLTGEILGAIWQAVALLKAQPHKNFGLKRKDKRDLQTDQLLFSKVFNYVNQVLNVLQPELYLRPEQPMGLALANCQEKGVLVPSFVVGSDLLQGRPEKELAFAIARQLTFIRPEHYLRLAVPTVSELKVVFLAALKLAQPNMPVKGDLAVIGQYVDAMRRTVAPNVLEQLAMVAQRFMQTRTEADINKWTQVVELTAHRAGFVLCNDLEIAAKMVSAEPVPLGGMSAKDKIRELVLYSISEEYFAVRQHLGLNIG